MKLNKKHTISLFLTLLFVSSAFALTIPKTNSIELMQQRIEKEITNIDKPIFIAKSILENTIL